jgi:hypothetical protein
MIALHINILVSGVTEKIDYTDLKNGQGEFTMIREATSNFFPPMLASVLGMEETRILDLVKACPSDVQSIHFQTGLPLPCIEGNLRALVHLGLVRILHDGRFVCDGHLAHR